MSRIALAIACSILVTACRPPREHGVRESVEERCDLEEGAKVVQSGKAGALVQIANKPLEVWPVGGGRWALSLDEGEVAAIGHSTVAVARMRASPAAWHAHVRWLGVLGGESWIARDVVGIQSSVDGVQAGLSGVAVGPDDSVWLTGRFPGELRADTADWGVGSFTAVRIEKASGQIARFTRLPGGKSGTMQAIPCGDAVMLIAGGRCSSSMGCVGILRVGADDPDLWEHSRLDAAVGTTDACVFSLQPDGGLGESRIVVQSQSRRRSLQIDGQIHLIGAVTSSRGPVLFLRQVGAVRINGLAMPTGGEAGRSIALRLTHDWDVDTAAVLDAEVKVYSFGAQFIAEADGKMRWPRHCPFRRQGVRFVTDADIQDVFAH